MPQLNAILAMDPDKYREIDGVVFDLDSYARHCRPAEASAAAEVDPAPAPVFPVEPYPDGWYPAENGQPPVPIMGGAQPPDADYVSDDGTVIVTRTIFTRLGSGSGSGSYITSYTTSYRSSGSGSYRFGSCTWLVGGYGLELV